MKKILDEPSEGRLRQGKNKLPDGLNWLCYFAGSSKSHRENIFGIPSSSRHEKCYQINQTLFWVFQYSRNSQWCVPAYRKSAIIKFGPSENRPKFEKNLLHGLGVYLVQTLMWKLRYINTKKVFLLNICQCLSNN